MAAAVPLISLSRSSGVLRTTALLLTALLAATLSGGLRPLERALADQMARQPLPPAYFLLFILVGALLPLLLRLLHRRQPEAAAVLNPYLLLLAGQILSEMLVITAGGKGLGVLVGLIFTLTRLVQLPQLGALAGDRRWLQRLLGVELLLWSVNVAQMLVFRWWPLLG